MSTEIKKKNIAREILSLQKTLIISVIPGMITVGICFFLFKPFKFDSAKYQNWQGLSYSKPQNINYTPANRNNPNDIRNKLYDPYQNTDQLPITPAAMIPSYLTDGFFDYLDAHIRWNPTNFRESYKERKEFLVWKMLRFGLYSLVLSFMLLTLIRYGITSQRWVLMHAKDN